MPYTQNITDSNEILVSWTPIDGVDRYSLLHMGMMVSGLRCTMVVPHPICSTI